MQKLAADAGLDGEDTLRGVDRPARCWPTVAGGGPGVPGLARRAVYVVDVGPAG